VQKQFLFYLSITLFIWLFISFFLTAGITFSGHWSALSKIQTENTAASWTLRAYFQHPFSAVLSQILLFSLTMIFLQMTLSLLYVLIKSKKLIIGLGVFLFLGAIIGFKLLPESLKGIALPNYLSLYHSVNQFDSAVISFYILGILLLISFFLMTRIDLNSINLRHLFLRNGSFILYSLLCLLGIISTALKLKEEDATIWDVWVQAFYGSNSESFNFTSYLFYIIVFFGFVYFVQLFLQKELSETGYYKLIRFQSLPKWFWSWFKKVLLSIVAFLTVLFLTTLITGWLFGFSSAFEVRFYPGVFVKDIIWQFFMIGSLQIISYILLVFIVSWFSQEVIKSLIMNGILFVVMLPGINSMDFWPVGLNGLGYITNGVAWSVPFWILTVFIAIEAVIIYFLLTKRDYQV
jgi:hypothetical protein